MDKKYQIFISSTYTDLIAARNRVRDAVLSMMHFPVGMEMFSAADEEQWEIIRDTISSSDYYILIVGHRYGSTIDDGEDVGISYTEKEFQYARKIGIPILAFILSDDADIKKANVETDAMKSTKLHAFKEAVKTGRLVEWWNTPDDLALKVTAALHKQMDRKKRPGWVRGDSFDIEASHAEILSLNKRIRELEEENQRLKSQIFERKPKLTLEFLLEEATGKDKNKPSIEDECRSHGNLVTMQNSFSIQIKFVPINAENFRYQYEPLDMSCVEPHLKRYVSNEALKKYNSLLPSDEEISRYIKELANYQRIRNSGIAFILQIANDGTAKATDVRAFVDFPKEFLLFEVSDIEDIETPEAPTLPNNPITEAEREYERRMDPLADVVHQMGISLRPFDFPPNLGSLNAKIHSTNTVFSNQSLFLNDHEISAEAKQIPHRDLEWFRDIYIVPTARGHFQIKVNLMCSEYIEPEESLIDIEVI